MAKRLSSVYQPGERSKDWLKVKVTFDADVVIVGWTEGEGSRAGSLGSLMMAVYDGNQLRYVGNVGHRIQHSFTAGDPRPAEGPPRDRPTVSPTRRFSS